MTTTAGRRPAWLLLLLFAIASSCSTAPPMPDPPATHPASPLADAAPESAPSSTLVMPKREPRGSGEAAGAGRRGH